MVSLPTLSREEDLYTPIRYRLELILLRITNKVQLNPKRFSFFLFAALFFSAGYFVARTTEFKDVVVSKSEDASVSKHSGKIPKTNNAALPDANGGRLTNSTVIESYDPTIASEALMADWRLKAKEKDPYRWVSNLDELIKNSSKWDRRIKFMVFLEFLSHHELNLDADSFSKCVKLAHETLPALSETSWDLDGTKLDKELGERLFRVFKKEGRADEFFLSLASGAEGANKIYSAKMLSVLCDETKRMEQWSASEISDPQMKSAVQANLFNDWLAEKRMISAKKFLDPGWNVGEPKVAVDQLFDQYWFDNNTLEISTLIRDAPESSRRNELIQKMIDRLNSTDPSAASAWAAELNK